MAKIAAKPLTIKQISGRSVASLAFLTVLVLAMSVGVYYYLTQQAKERTQQSIARLTITEELTRSISHLQVLEGDLTMAAVQRNQKAIAARSDVLLDHLSSIDDQIDLLVEISENSRLEIKKVTAMLVEIFTDISIEVETLVEHLQDGDSIQSHAGLFAKYNQDVRELNNSIAQLRKLFVKVITLQHQLTRQNQIYYSGAAAMLVLLILFVVLAFRWNNRMVVSLGQLRKSIERINSGDFSEVEIAAKDEIAATALMFNQTLDQYKDAIIADSERETTQENLINFLEVVSEAADGDLTMKAPVTADAFGSIADAYNLMVESLSALLTDTRKNANDVGEQTKNLIQNFSEMEMGADMQSIQVEKAIEAVRSSAVAANAISKKAVLAQQTSAQVDVVTERGSGLVTDNIEGMQLIRVTVQVINKKMKSLSERLLEIGTISQLISEIATRTTILAMNASIEASRAGEQGRGFLVISDEIKRLADKSAEATKQINGVIKSIQTEAGEVTASLEEETKTVEGQTRLAQDTGDAFQAIQEAIQKSKSVVTEISTLSNDQLEMTNNVDLSMTKVAEISELILNQVKDSALITTGLTEQSTVLLSSVDTFRLTEDD
ncbi:MAG: HAMP domain-containing protein [Desulfuromonas sp.]|nr:HAMP domain-containing protein [Desulfuromonas sp.]